MEWLAQRASRVSADLPAYLANAANPAHPDRRVLPEWLVRRVRTGHAAQPARRARKDCPVPLGSPAQMGRWALRGWLARLGKPVPKVCQGPKAYKVHRV